MLTIPPGLKRDIFWAKFMAISYQVSPALPLGLSDGN
jgi:hypothetical protein